MYLSRSAWNLSWSFVHAVSRMRRIENVLQDTTVQHKRLNSCGVANAVS